MHSAGIHIKLWQTNAYLISKLCIIITIRMMFVVIFKFSQYLLACKLVCMYNYVNELPVCNTSL